MIRNTDSSEFKYYFPTDPHLFVSEAFINLNAPKVDTIVRLIQDTDKVQLGLIAGIANGILKAPFSAPFGGFHFKNESMYTTAIESYIKDLVDYAIASDLSEIRLTLSPDIYSQSFNAKLVNVLLRMNFTMAIPEITNWVVLDEFNGIYSHNASRTYYNQSVKNKLEFHQTDKMDEMEAIYNLIVENRSRMGRPIYMTFNDLLAMGNLFEVDYFKVITEDGQLVAGGMFYHSNPQTAYAVFWGDALEGRPLRAMDYLIFKLWEFYKNSGFKYIDLGISTESGMPNEGLLRFKETHECLSSLKYSFSKSL